ncbi:MAG TPA: sugar ABC transporter permease, partial [Lachnospiraceae bacterium]|nr:sugar ABC transporter permease [Lachnospiraceae bacterium]
MTYGKNPSSKKRRILSNESKWGYLFTLYPLFDALIISFQNFKPLKTEWVGFDNYITTFKNSLFYKSIINT